MKNILVTGGAGFIGSNFIRHSLKTRQDLQVINLDLLTYAGSLENLKDLPGQDRHTFIQGDICDTDLVRGLVLEYEIQLVVHFAAESHVDRSISAPDVFIRTNILGTFSLLEALRAAWTEGSGGIRQDVRLHHISTDEVYGSLKPGDPAFTEASLIAPNSPYAASKAASDHLVRSYFHTYGLPAAVTNCSNNYGPYQFPEKLIPLMILNALEGRPLPIYGDGRQIRDWLYVDDHCRAIWAVIEGGKAGETYNIGGDNQPTNLEIVSQICSLLDGIRPEESFVPHRQLVEHVPDRPGHDRRYAMDIRKVSSELGWKPQVDLSQGLRETISWYLEHPEWVRKIRENQGYQTWVRENYQQREGI